MKNNKILQSILLLPLLASCGTSSSLRKASFKGYTNKVNFTDFYESYLTTEAFFQKAGVLSSAVATSFSDYKTTSVQKRGGKQISSMQVIDTETKNGGYDSSNKVFCLNNERKLITASLDSYTNQKSSLASDGGKQYQQNSIEGKDYVVFIDFDTKIYSLEGEVSETLTVEIMARTLLAKYPSMSVRWQDYESKEEGEKSYFSFYKDDNVFTIVYNKEYDDENFISVEETSQAKLHSKIEEKWQLIVNDTSVKVAYDYKANSQITALTKTNYNTFSLLKDDVIEQTKEESKQYEVNVGSYNKSAEDLSKYSS